MALQSQPRAVCDGAARGIPARATAAPGGREFLSAAGVLTDVERDTTVREALLAGDVPDFLRHLLPVTVRGNRAGGANVSLTLCVMPDYLSLGRDDDFVRTPMGLPTALEVAGRFGLMLPTRRIVDLIYQQALRRLAPQPLAPDDRMRSLQTAGRHQSMVEAQRVAAGARLGELTAGHKKDLVLTTRLLTDPGKVAIYGWHRSVEAPIQPLSTVHGERYADYSHGVRLLAADVLVDGRLRPLADVLADPELAGLLSDEGPLPEELLRR